MASVNKVILIGNLGADPESRFAPSGDAICNIRLATTENWRDKNTGERREATEWHRVSFYGKLAGVLVAPVLGGGEANVADRVARRSEATFRIGAEVADQDDFIDGCHPVLL